MDSLMETGLSIPETKVKRGPKKGSKRRSRDLTFAVRFANAVNQIEAALADIKEVPAELERIDAIQRELRRLVGK
jgi:hypothetical protein